MIVYLGVSIEELQQLPAAEMEELLSEIGRSSRRGYHLYVLRRSIAKFASEQECLGDLHRSEFKRLQADATQNFSLLSSAIKYIEIEIGDQLKTVPERKKWVIGHKKVLESELLSKSKLILEDAHSDGEVYRMFLDKGTAVGRGFKIQFEAHHGGGNQTFRRLREQVAAGSVSVCICDHDMYAPNSARSDTFNKAKAESEKRDFIGKFFTPPFRELENLIPLRVLRDFYPLVSPVRLDVLEQGIQAQGDVLQGDCLWLYFDVKEGVTGELLLKKCPGEKSQEWLRSKYLYGATTRLEEVSFPGFGDSVINTILNSGPALKELHSFLRSTYWKKHLHPFFEEVAWYLVGERRARL